MDMLQLNLSHLFGQRFVVSALYLSDTYDQQKREKVFGFRYKRPRSDILPRKNNFVSRKKPDFRKVDRR
jgi:hypothetical protein